MLSKFKGVCSSFSVAKGKDIMLKLGLIGDNMIAIAKICKSHLSSNYSPAKTELIYPSLSAYILIGYLLYRNYAGFVEMFSVLHKKKLLKSPRSTKPGKRGK